MPLQLTDLATVTAAYALWSQQHWAYALTYYWGLVLSTQALISPALQSPDFPHYQFLAFWAIHLLVVWAAIYLTWGRVCGQLAQLSPRRRRHGGVGGGYLHVQQVRRHQLRLLNRKPSTASLLDVLGPWPLYVFTAAALILGVWALMTWPWERIAATR